MGKTIYVSAKGNDSNDGLSPQKPLRTIEAAMSLGYSPGDSLLFEGGSVFHGNMVFKNLRGPFTVGSYGPGHATICSGNQSAIVFEGCSDIVLVGLKLEGEGWRVCNNSTGVKLVDCQRALVLNVEAAKFHKSGISCIKSKDVRIYGCFAHDNGAVGINTSGRDGICEDIHIAYCKAYDNAGDHTAKDNHSGSGIIISGTSRCVVEFCEAAGNGWAQRQINVNGPVGIWCCCGCTDVIFRWNIARYNRTQPGTVDGDGLDIDGEVANGVMEYNYTYGNEGSGYLLCEFWGDCSEVLWSNNVTRYCVSFEDASRVKGYGAINISSPQDIPFEKLYIENSLFVAYKNKHSVYNKHIPDSCKDIVIRNNVLVTDGTQAVEAPENPYTEVYGNTEFADDAVRMDIIRHAPLLVEPRDLLKLPVFKMLEDGSCARVLREKGAVALFGERAAKERPVGDAILTLMMDGPDLEGCAYSGDVKLHYDSIKPGVCTRMSSEGSQFIAPIPWWTKDKRYVISAKARLQSPDVVACLFLRDSERNEQKAYFSGSVAEYTTAEIEFTGNDKWFDTGKYIGVRHEGGRGCVFVDSIEFIELDENCSYAVKPNLKTLAGWRIFGDCFEEDSAISLNGFRSGISRTIQNTGKNLTVSAICKVEEGEGMVYIKNGNETEATPVNSEEWQRISVSLDAKEEFTEIGFWNTSGNPYGKVIVKDVKML